MGEGCSYQTYPPPMATYEDVIVSPSLFIESLKNLHASMGTKFMIPIVGGKDLDLFRLFVEVTSRGGIAKVVNERKWKEVTAVFNFPSSATNASFILRKYYISLLYHYEQIYLFKAKLWTTSPTDALQNESIRLTSPQHQANIMPQVPIDTSVCGVIDGKFDSGYLITVKIGSDELKGVLYQVPNSEPERHSSVVKRRKRRKKCEMRKRDPDHPKPNRSGYNFFFAEQHAKLKPHYQGRDREISRIIGDSWNKLQEPERAVYQEKALKDKERYRIEMEGYRERLRIGSANILNPQFEMSSDNRCNLEEDDDDDDEKDSDCEAYSQVEDTELKNVNIQVLANEEFDLQTRAGEDDENENKTLD